MRYPMRCSRPSPSSARLQVALRGVARTVVSVVALGGMLLSAGVSAQEPDSAAAELHPNVVGADQAAGPEGAWEALESVLDARLSPDGRRVAFRTLEGSSPRLFVRGALDSLGVPRPLSPPELAVGTYAWAPDGRHLVLRVRVAGGEERLHLVSVDFLEGSSAVEQADTPDAAEPGPPPDPRVLVPEEDGPVRLVGFAEDPVAALVEVPGAEPDAPDLVRVDLRTGDRGEVVVNDGSVHRWVPDEVGAGRLGLRTGPEGETEVVRRRDDEVVPIHRCTEGEVCDPVGFHPDGRIWVRSSRDRDTPALILLDPLTLDEEVVRTNLTDDPEAAFRSDSTFREAVGTLREAVGDARLAFHPDDPRRADASRMLVTARSGDDASIYLLDRWAGEATRILTLDPRADELLASGLVRPRAAAGVLEPARLAYTVTTDEPGSAPLTVERRIERDSEDGRSVWRVVDVAEVPTYAASDFDAAGLPEDPDVGTDPFEEVPEPEGRTEASDTIVLDAESLRPVRRGATGPLSLRVDFGDERVVGVAETDGFETPFELELDEPVWADGAALEMLVAALPLEEGYATRFTLFDAEVLELVTQDLVVEGRERVTTDAGTFDTWRLILTSDGSEGDPDGAREEWLVLVEAPHHLVRAVVRTDGLVRTLELTDAGGHR